MKKKYIMAYVAMCSLLCTLRFLYIKAVSYTNQTHGAQPDIHLIADKNITQNCATIIKETARIHNYNAQTTLRLLQKTMPLLQTIAIQKRGNNTYNLQIKTDNPLYTISTPKTWYLVSEKGTYTTQPFFDQKDLDYIPDITIKKNDLCDIRTIIKHFATYNKKDLIHISKNYSIDWHKKTCIWYNDKKNQSSIICTWQTPLEKNKLDRIYTCAQKHKKISTPWKADTRFNNQIIFSKIKPTSHKKAVLRGERK